jgi:hypothetical protein
MLLLRCNRFVFSLNRPFFGRFSLCNRLFAIMVRRGCFIVRKQAVSRSTTSAGRQLQHVVRWRENVRRMEQAEQGDPLARLLRVIKAAAGR